MHVLITELLEKLNKADNDQEIIDSGLVEEAEKVLGD